MWAFIFLSCVLCHNSTSGCNHFEFGTARRCTRRHYSIIKISMSGFTLLSEEIKKNRERFDHDEPGGFYFW